MKISEAREAIAMQDWMFFVKNADISKDKELFDYIREHIPPLAFRRIGDAVAVNESSGTDFTRILEEASIRMPSWSYGVFSSDHNDLLMNERYSGDELIRLLSIWCAREILWVSREHLMDYLGTEDDQMSEARFLIIKSGILISCIYMEKFLRGESDSLSGVEAVTDSQKDNILEMLERSAPSHSYASHFQTFAKSFLSEDPVCVGESVKASVLLTKDLWEYTDTAIFFTPDGRAKIEKSTRMAKDRAIEILLNEGIEEKS